MGMGGGGGGSGMGMEGGHDYWVSDLMIFRTSYNWFNPRGKERIEIRESGTAQL